MLLWSEKPTNPEMTPTLHQKEIYNTHERHQYRPRTKSRKLETDTMMASQLDLGMAKMTPKLHQQELYTLLKYHQQGQQIGPGNIQQIPNMLSG